MDAVKSSVCWIADVDLLHPELMTADTIINILKERHIKHPRLEELDKVSLVELYNGTVLPFPQRDYKNNRLGNCLGDRRKALEGQKRKLVAKEDKAAPRETKRSKTHDSHQSSRLKPPPEHKPSSREKAARMGNHTDSSRNGSGQDTGGRGSAKTHESKHFKYHTAEDGGSPSRKKRRPITWP